jgi:hypothetical protein
MNYQKHYDLLMNRARTRTLEGYCEKHHAIPRCMGGDNSKENIVRLTPEEHYLAHQLLIKMYPENRRLAHAANLMSTRCSNNKTFGWIRKHLGFRHTPETIAKFAPKLKGRVFTPEWRAKISAANKGKKRNWIPTVEQRFALGERNRLRGQSPEAREKIGASKRGKKRAPFSLETRQRMSIAFTGRKHTAETIAKLSATASKRLISRDANGRIVGHRRVA